MAEDAPEWVNLADVQRSHLDADVWWPWYGGDKSCFQYCGRLRAVRRHVEDATYWPGADASARWRRLDPNHWVYEIPQHVAAALEGPEEPTDGRG
jgi:hypothetical protein